MSTRYVIDILSFQKSPELYKEYIIFVISMLPVNILTSTKLPVIKMQDFHINMIDQLTSSADICSIAFNIQC